ncbi:hypothetical protein [Porphyromonas gingivicanis]|uniref:hypothetical protein n=1 Tax=Porphyromonas gingivicanis TaxID=266762 RepID=UPI00046ED08F|nr:hypothetical protein [Porphyromonas gingivicanis]
MWNGNDYKRGWEDGHRDALSSKDKDTLRMGLSVKFFLWGRPALDTYTQGYHEGYAKGISERHVVHRVSVECALERNQDHKNKQEYSMTYTSHDFVRELQALKDLHQFLVQFTDWQIMNRLNEYYGAIQMLIDSGVPRQQCETYITTHFEADKALYAELLCHITDADLPRIQFYMEEINRHMQAATSMSAGSFHLSHPDTSARPARPRNIIERQGGIADLVIQADAICDFSDFLKGTVESLCNSLQEYERYCNSLLDAGVPKQMYEDYLQQYASVDAQLIHKIMGRIEHEDIPYLKKVFVQITSSINSLGGAYNRSI